MLKLTLSIFQKPVIDDGSGERPSWTAQVLFTYETSSGAVKEAVASFHGPTRADVFGQSMTWVAARSAE